jgi:hypothetical protein
MKIWVVNDGRYQGRRDVSIAGKYEGGRRKEEVEEWSRWDASDIDGQAREGSG